MKKLADIQRGNDIRCFVSSDNKVSFPLNLSELDYMTPINLYDGTYAERIDYRTYEPFDGSTINELIACGKLIEKTIVPQYEVYLEKFENCGIHPNRLPYKKIIGEFKKHGFNVTRKAIKHNYEAWLVDCKSGYRDEDNDYFLFTPCGCNTLCFTASKLDNMLDWQEETYGAKDVW